MWLSNLNKRRQWDESVAVTLRIAVWGVTLWGIAVCGLAGCATETTIAEHRAVWPEQPAASYGDRRGDREANPLLADLESRHTLTTSELAESKRILLGLADDGSPSQTLTRGLRWSDVPSALTHAVNRKGVEMAIVTTDRTEDGDQYTFNLRTIEDRQAVLVVRRTHDDRVYEVTRAEVGMFGADTARAEKLVKAFDDAMDRQGRRRGFAD